MRALAARLAWAAATLLVVYVAAFALLHAVPGDPLDKLGDPSIPAEQAERTRKALGLDRPLVEQSLATLGSLLRGEAGTSITWGRPVSEVLAASLPSTVLLCSVALLIAYALGLGGACLLGFASPRAQELAERASLLVGTLPRFWLGLMLVLVFHDGLEWLPASHAVTPGGGAWLDRATHLVLPALALALPSAALLLRLHVAALRESLGQVAARTSELAGLSRRRIVLRDGLRPQLGLAVTMLGLDLPALVSGALVVEVVFAWPGVGRVTADALLGGDYPLALAMTMLAGLVVVSSNAAADLVARRLDPRRVSAPGP